jgi:hypothetical protein
MNGRRGVTTIETIVGFALALFSLALLLYLVGNTNRTFIDSLTCNEDGTGLVQVPAATGCRAEDNRDLYLMGFFGRDKGKVCCEITNYDENDPATWQGQGGVFGGGGASATWTATSVATGRQLTEGQTILLYPSSAAQSEDKGARLTGQVSCPKAADCAELKCQETLLTASGTDASRLLAKSACVAGKLPAGTQADGAAKFVGDVQVTPDSAYADQTLTYTLTVSKGDAVLESYKLNFRIDTPIKVAGLTQQWSRRKEVTAACTSPVTCSDILFIARNPQGSATSPVVTCSAADVANAETAATTLKTSYCIAKDGEIDEASCSDTLADCTKKILDQNDADYSSAYHAIIAAAKQGLIPENVASQFSTAQGTTSTYACVKSVPGADSSEQIYRVPVDPTTGRASFTLEHAAFENKQLCIYAKDKTATAGGKPVYYVAKGPTRLTLDVTPPTATLDFRASSLQLRFACQDNAGGSGCKEGFGLAYIGEAGKFLRSLVAKDTPQNAAAWCPQYATANGYSVETRPIIQYNEREVRVLCLRVEDQAGNAGVAMANVYNAYDLLAQAIAEAIRQEGK